jgi:hypothetical protein
MSLPILEDFFGIMTSVSMMVAKKIPFVMDFIGNQWNIDTDMCNGRNVSENG